MREAALTETGPSVAVLISAGINAQHAQRINPILPPHSADPWMIFHGGAYYYSESRNKRQIYIRRSRNIAGIGQDPGVRVWTAPSRGRNSDNV